MKYCPGCKERYSDDDLNFCLADGSTLKRLKGGRSKGSAKETLNFTIENVLLRPLQVVALLGLVTSLGSCVACVGLSETRYGQEEEYAPGKMGARSYSANPEQDKVLAIVSVVSGVVFILVGFGSMVVREILAGSEHMSVTEVAKEIADDRRINKAIRRAEKAKTDRQR